MINITEYLFTEDQLAEILAECIVRESPANNVYDRTIFWREILAPYGIELDHFDDLLAAIEKTFKITL